MVESTGLLQRTQAWFLVSVFGSSQRPVAQASGRSDTSSYLGICTHRDTYTHIYIHTLFHTHLNLSTVVRLASCLKPEAGFELRHV